MTTKMTLRERIRTALRNGMPDQIPFTCYHEMAPSEDLVRRLNKLGFSLIWRREPFRFHRPNVETSIHKITDEKYPTEVIVHKTPVGTLTQKAVFEPGYGSRWPTEHFVKRPEDYAVLEFIIRDTVCVDDIDGFVSADRDFGDLGMAIPRAADPPILELWRRLTGLERFSYDWFDCREEVQRVLAALNERNKKIWEITANTPCDFCCSGGNMTGDVVSPELFETSIMPHFEAEAAIMHGIGKTTLNHMDGMLKSLVDVIARCPVDVIEAFNALDGNVTLTRAREAWSNKALSINFPSSVHLAPPERIRQTTIDILRDVAPGNGFIVGITENVPHHVIDRSFTVIAETLDRWGRCPVDADALPQ
jgi:hypothetical protein